MDVVHRALDAIDTSIGGGQRQVEIIEEGVIWRPGTDVGDLRVERTEIADSMSTSRSDDLSIGLDRQVYPASVRPRRRESVDGNPETGTGLYKDSRNVRQKGRGRISGGQPGT